MKDEEEGGIEIQLWRNIRAKKRAWGGRVPWPGLLAWLEGCGDSSRKKVVPNDHVWKKGPQPGGEGPGGYKKQLAGWTPITLADETGSKKNSNVEKVWLLVLDFDEDSGATYDGLRELFGLWAGFAYATWSHRASDERWRVVLLLEGPVAPNRYRRLWKWAEARCKWAGLVLDDSTKNPSRFWFLPIKKAPSYRASKLQWPGSDGDGGVVHPLPVSLALSPKYRGKNGATATTMKDEWMTIRTKDDVTSVETWAKDASPGDKLKCYCPFGEEHEGHSADAAYLERFADSVRVRCFAASHPAHAGIRMEHWWIDPKLQPKGRNYNRPIAGDLEWRFKKDVNGDMVRDRPMSHTVNAYKLLSNDLHEGRIWYDSFRERKMFSGFTGEDIHITKPVKSQFQQWLIEAWAVNLGRNVVGDVVDLIASENKRNTLQEHLDAMPEWDGTTRLDSWLETALGCPDDELHRNYGAKFLIQAVARAYEPGCQADSLLVVAGPQGVGKSRLVRALAGPGFWKDTKLTLGNKDAYINLKGAWVYEFAELDAIKSPKDTEAVKAFISSPTDHYRPLFAEASVDMPRQTVFIGTTNEKQFLHDYTGSRRFWCVSTAEIDIDWVVANRTQLFAEAKARYSAGENWWLGAAEEALRHQHNERYRDDYGSAMEQSVGDQVAKHGLTAVRTSDMMKLLGLQLDRGSETKVGMALRAFGWKKTRISIRGKQQAVYHVLGMTSAEVRAAILEWMSGVEHKTVDADGNLVSFDFEK